jgi:hypothetical protein
VSTGAEPDRGHGRVRQYGWCTPAMHGHRVYAEFCHSANLPPVRDGYGLLLVLDAGGHEHTLATTDVRYLCLLHHGLHELGPMDVSFPPGKFEHVRRGWLQIPASDG